MSEPITQERMENAMDFLASTDDAYAEAKANVLRAEILVKRIRARLFIAEEGSVEVRKAKAEAHQEAIDGDEALCSATLAFEALKARRSRAEILIDVYRTLEASRRKS